MDQMSDQRQSPTSAPRFGLGRGNRGTPGSSRSGLPPAGERNAASALSRLSAGGTEGNERLTVQTGALLFVLLAVLGVTILRIGQLLWLHLFLGLVLLGPVALKLASTGYRFVRYYTSEPRYRRKGPPPQLLRLLGPVLVISTLTVFASGVALLALGPSSRGSLLLVHKVSFFVWLAVTVLHVLGHLPEIRRGLLGERRLRGEILTLVDGGGGTGPPTGDGSPRGIAGIALASRRPGSQGRALALILALVVGLSLATALIPDFAPWLHHHDQFLRHH
jgi:hypothetical protein